MDGELKHRLSYSLAVVSLSGHEQIRVEPGAMVSYTAGLETETRAEGGLMGGLKRMIGGENFFINTWQAPVGGGEMTLAPALPGDLLVLDIAGQDYLLQSGSYIASEASLAIDSTWGGSKGFFGSGSLILLRVSGKVLLGCYGATEERVLKAGEPTSSIPGTSSASRRTCSFVSTKSEAGNRPFWVVRGWSAN